ncbi:peptidoglycan recognition protein family protein [Companilactobacillus hulinensis]|uniref:peptidoglycan recognition protein family protein n=1 Tax=Companilactobacillus hulinensis TaxID=2486007 RepID=UPI000F7ADC52|nr:peptidoglycan recognition family protein [Companilactobacillus hulinensis]
MFKGKKIWILGVLSIFFGMLLLSSNNTDVEASQINDYIINNKIQPASIQYRTGTFTEWIPYENGVGKPEGVVVHETATPGATAENEVTLFNREWRNMQTYVHAFTDDKQIINIHSADYGVWGAGPTANAKYIQIELCEVNSYDGFAHSLANDAYYIASKLIQYNLPDIPGQTVVSHHEVSNMYHQTTHVDPDTYFARKGYSMAELNQLISLYYNNLKATGNVYGVGNTTNAGSNNNTNNTGNTATPSKGVIKVNNANGYYVPLMALQGDGTFKPVKNRALANNTPWVTDKTKTYNGITYRRVATNEWVDSSYII